MNADEEPEAIMARMQHVLSFPDPLLNVAMGNVVSAQLYAQIDTQVGKHVFTLVSKLQRGGALLAQTLAHAPTPTAAAAAAAAPVLAWRATSAVPATTLEQADLRGGLRL